MSRNKSLTVDITLHVHCVFIVTTPMFNLITVNFGNKHLFKHFISMDVSHL